MLGNLDLISAFKVDQEFLALVFDAMTFLVSAAIVYRLPIPRSDRPKGARIDWTETFRDIKEGLQFISHQPLVRGVIIGLGFGIIGAGAMIPLGPSFATEVLNGGSAAFGALMTALGFGAAFGVVGLLWFQNRLPRGPVFAGAVMGVGAFLVLAASCSSLAPAVLFIGAVGACAGTSYVTGFTLLQENSSDEIRGRTFATLYTVIRLCLLDLAHDLAVVGGLLGLGHQPAAHRPDRRDRFVHLRHPRCARRALGWWAHRVHAPASSRCARCGGRAASQLGEQSTPEAGHGEHLMPGRFVVLEGGDGSGKSTQAARLAAELRDRGVAVCETFEPGATGAGAVIRELLLHRRETIAPDDRGAAHGGRSRAARCRADRACPRTGRLGRVRPLPPVVARLPGDGPRHRRARRSRT